MNPLLPQFATALAFYSRIKVPAELPRAPLASAVALAPLAGLAVALPAGLVLVALHGLGASALVAAVLATATTIVLTGALHEDGLADCADGFWGGADAARRLEIMRDSRIGSYGVLALVGAVLLKVAILASAVASSPLFAMLMLLASAAASRAVALYPWVGLVPARRDGLAVAIGRPTIATFRRAIVIAAAATAILVAWWAPVGFVLAAVAAAGAAKACATLADHKIGGHTGDVIGATVVVADMTYLLVLTMWTL